MIIKRSCIVRVAEAEHTLQHPVDLPMLSQLLQLPHDCSQVDFVLLEGLTAATVQLDGPLCKWINSQD